MTNYFISTTIDFASLYDPFFYFSSEKKNKSEKFKTQLFQKGLEYIQRIKKIQIPNIQ